MLCLGAVRPVLPKELEAASSSGAGDTAASSSLVLAVKPTTQYDLVLPEAPSDRQGGRMQKAETFEFDRVFGPDSTQAAVFDEVQVCGEAGTLEGHGDPATPAPMPVVSPW